MQWGEYGHFTINKLVWERIFLNFDVQTDISEDCQFALIRASGSSRKIKPDNEVVGEIITVDVERYSATEYKLPVNLCCVKDRSFLENGEWRLCAYLGEILYPVAMRLEIGHSLDDFSRIFPYGNKKYCYNVYFTARKLQGQTVELILNSYFMSLNKHWRKRNLVREASTAKGRKKGMKRIMRVWGLKISYALLSRFYPKKGNTVLFMSETKGVLNGNLLAICNRMKERKLDEQFRILYSFNEIVSGKRWVKDTLKSIVLIAKSDFILVDNYTPIFAFFKLSPKTTLIQVWHAGVGFKSVGYSRFGKSGSPHPIVSCHKAYDYAIVASENLRQVYQEVFGIERDAVVPYGMARLDGFLAPEKIEHFRSSFYETYPSLKGKRIILFAPTFRGTGQKDASYDYKKLDFEALYSFCKGDTVFMMKMHPFVGKKPPIPEEYTDRIVDFSSYPNINELYYIADILITDYSSDYYEFSLMQRPILFYTYDREYYEITRGVHRRIAESAPGKICDTFEELISALETGDYEFEKTEKFYADNFSTYGQNAADRLIDNILLKKREDRSAES